MKDYIHMHISIYTYIYTYTIIIDICNTLIYHVNKQHKHTNSGRYAYNQSFGALHNFQGLKN